MKYPRRKPRSYELLGEIHGAVYGEARTKRLAELATEANTNHHHAEEHWQGFLNCARQAGIALMHAKRILGRRSKWSTWRARNFQGSIEKCNQYIRVARHWDDPRIVEARKETTINSVEGFLDVIRNRRKKDAPSEARKQSEREIECQELRGTLREWFSQSIQQLSLTELDVFADGFYQFFWDDLYPVLQQRVCLVKDCDWYADPDAPEGFIGATRADGTPLFRGIPRRRRLAAV